MLIYIWVSCTSLRILKSTFFLHIKMAKYHHWMYTFLDILCIYFANAERSNYWSFGCISHHQKFFRWLLITLPWSVLDLHVWFPIPTKKSCYQLLYPYRFLFFHLMRFWFSIGLESSIGLWMMVCNLQFLAI